MTANLVNSMVRRLQAIINAEGLHTNYDICLFSRIFNNFVARILFGLEYIDFYIICILDVIFTLDNINVFINVSLT